MADVPASAVTPAAPERRPASARTVSRSLWLWAPVVLYMAAIFAVSSMSRPPLPADVSDKSAHTLAYAGLAVLVVRALGGGLPARVGWRLAGLSVAITVGYGISDEIHQMFVPGRMADLHDVYADAAGAVLGVGFCWLWGIIRFARPR
jgi:VanZ family protein